MFCFSLLPVAELSSMQAGSQNYWAEQYLGGHMGFFWLFFQLAANFFGISLFISMGIAVKVFL